MTDTVLVAIGGLSVGIGLVVGVFVARRIGYYLDNGNRRNVHRNKDQPPGAE